MISPAPVALSRFAYDSPTGRLHLIASLDALVGIWWPDNDGDPFDATDVTDVTASSTHHVLASAVAQLDEYFAGHRQAFDLPLAPRGTAFQLTAWEALRKIPFGETRSYSQQAVTVGRPSAVRAIGAANGRNPLPIVVPCHRVIGSNGSMTGFAGGLDMKRWLLDHERRVVDASGSSGRLSL